MKTRSVVMMCLLVATALVCVAPAFQKAEAQVVRIVDLLFQEKRLANSGKDSAVVNNAGQPIPIEYNGNVYPELRGQWPDSIRVAWRARNDSTYRVFVRFKAKHPGTSVFTSVLVDSIKQTAAAYETDFKLIAPTNYYSYEALGVSLVAADTINATLTANAARISVWIERYFKKP